LTIAAWVWVTHSLTGDLVRIRGDTFPVAKLTGDHIAIKWEHAMAKVPADIPMNQHTTIPRDDLSMPKGSHTMIPRDGRLVKDGAENMVTVSQVKMERVGAKADILTKDQGAVPRNIVSAVNVEETAVTGNRVKIPRNTVKSGERVRETLSSTNDIGIGRIKTDVTACIPVPRSTLGFSVGSISILTYLST